MQLIRSIVRPHKVDAVQDALTQVGVSGITVMEVRGHGHQQGRPAKYRGQEYLVTLLPKMAIECVVPDHLTRQAVIEAARTGEAE